MGDANGNDADDEEEDDEEEYKMENKSKLQKQCASMQEKCNLLQTKIDSLTSKQNECNAQINDIAQSKYQLIAATSSEIDALRNKIRMYTKGDWNGIIKS